MCSVSRNIPTGYDISISVPKIRDMDTVCRYIVLWHRMIWDMISRYIIAIYHAISHRITSKHKVNAIQRNPTTSLRSTLVFFGLVSALILACPRSGIFLPSFCCPSAGHIIGLTEPPANSSLFPWRLGLLPERMFVLLHFPIYFVFSFLSSRLFSFLIPGTWYSLVVATYFMLMICCCGEIVDVVYAIHV